MNAVTYEFHSAPVLSVAPHITRTPGSWSSSRDILRLIRPGWYPRAPQQGVACGHLFTATGGSYLALDFYRICYGRIMDHLYKMPESMFDCGCFGKYDYFQELILRNWKKESQPDSELEHDGKLAFLLLYTYWRCDFMLKKTVLTVFILVIFTSIAFADQETLYPTDDADVWQYIPDTNRGTEQGFQVGCCGSGYRRNSLIKFDLSSYSGATVNSAILRLWVYSSFGEFPTDSIYITRNNADWDELTVTWNNKPGYAEDTPIIAPSIYDWWEIDVTDWVQDIVDGTDPNYGFQIYKDDTDYAGFSMRTKEGSIDPELVLDYTPAALQATTFGRIKSLFD